MKPYLYIAKIRVLSSLAYRFDVLSSVLIQCLIMISTVFFWDAAYGAQSFALGVSKNQMLVYTIISGVLASLYIVGVEGRIESSIRGGNVALDMLKPVGLFGIYLAEDIGSIVSSFFLSALPILLIGGIFIISPLPASLFHFLFFLVSAVAGYILNWIFSALFSMLAFKIINMSPISAIKHHLVRILSGSIIPIWFFPVWLQRVIGILPFPYIFQLPFSIYIGKLNGAEMLMQIGIQFAWIVLLSVIFLYVQKKALSNVLVQGG